ncbi:MAG: lipoyl(octanoyl) transferase LipB [Chitinophagaceae bacterium]|nr:MAG: lipoyl(octanoyl) transferase LipB [Chitinophagaceae bacterium]
MTDVFSCELGLIDYKEAWDLQERIFAKIIETKVANRKLSPEEQLTQNHYLLLCSHPPVFTLGKNAKQEHLLLNEEQLLEKGISVYNINRGGDITHHGPGQIVGYPILDLDYFFTDIHKYLRLLEETIILTLKEYDIEAGRLKGSTGVWLDSDNPFRARKICAMGIRCSRWVTMHGWAFNVNNNLDYFNMIIPCGITDKQVTSMEKELGHKVDEAEVTAHLKKHFSQLFEARFTDMAKSHLSNI